MRSCVDARTEELPVAVRAQGLGKSFPGVRALTNVDFDVRHGEVHALMGENGAGKSTLIRILSGVHRADEGTITVTGAAVPFRNGRFPGSPGEAERAGISVVHQEIDLLPNLSVAENIGLGRQRTRFGLLLQRLMRERATAALARLGIALNVRLRLADCPIAVRQMVAIARALDVSAQLLILDEPTSSLDAEETARLFTMLRRLRDGGLAIVLISHSIGEVCSIADRITVLRNGTRVGTWNAPELPPAALVEMMTGRTVTSGERSSVAPAVLPELPALRAEDLACGHVLGPVTLSLHAGETLGIAGLLGSGRSELLRAIFGADAPDGGTVAVKGVRVRPGSVRASIAAGMAFLSEDRARDGVFADLSVGENLLMALQARCGAMRPIPRTEAKAIVDRFIAALGIRAASADAPIASLSGGNQQKVLLARWLAIEPTVLLLDEPTRGMDVGARAEIESLLASLRHRGLALAIVSSELDETVRTSQRVLVLRDRAVAGMIESADVSEGAILALVAHGGDPA